MTNSQRPSVNSTRLKGGAVVHFLFEKAGCASDEVVEIYVDKLINKS